MRIITKIKRIGKNLAFNVPKIAIKAEKIKKGDEIEITFCKSGRKFTTIYSDKLIILK